MRIKPDLDGKATASSGKTRREKRPQFVSSPTPLEGFSSHYRIFESNPDIMKHVAGDCIKRL
ncbi:hypothetical protein MCOR25_009554 [Pyricularia grisea]|nr:hypothetical protein MCOR25_009554 [Pyricularia grisea]